MTKIGKSFVEYWKKNEPFGCNPEEVAQAAWNAAIAAQTERMKKYETALEQIRDGTDPQRYAAFVANAALAQNQVDCTVHEWQTFSEAKCCFVRCKRCGMWKSQIDALESGGK